MSTSSTPDPLGGARAHRNHRLLWVTSTYPPSRGGMAWSCDRIVTGVRAAGVDVDVVHLTAADRPHRSTTAVGGRHLTVPLGADPEHAIRRVLGDLERLATDAPWSHLVVFGGTYPMVAGPVFAAWLGLPLVTLVRGNDLDTGALSLRRRGALLDCLRSSHAVCAVCTSHQRKVAALAPDRRVHLVANGIDPTTWQPLPSEREKAATWRHEHVAGGRTTIGVIGQLKAKKGIDWFVDRIGESGTGDAVHLVLVGEVEQVVLDAIDAQGPGLHSTRLPFLDRYELLSVLPACDLVALPSFYDGLPNVALEAAALGIPLLTSDAGGLGDLVVDGDNGFRFPAGDPGGAVDAICRAVDATPDTRSRMGAAARTRVEQHFGSEREIAGYLTVLDDTAR